MRTYFLTELFGDRCLKCEKRLLSHAKTASCVMCHLKCHLKCISLNTEELSSIINDSSWYCMRCITSALPFIGIDDDEEYIQALSCKGHFV